MEQEKINKILNGELLIDNLEDLLYMYNNHYDVDLLYNCNDSLKDNIEVAKFLCMRDFVHYLDVSDRLKESKELLLYMLENLEPYDKLGDDCYYRYSESGNGCCLLSEAKESLKKDKDIVRLAVEKDPFNDCYLADYDQREIYYADKSLLEDKEFVMELVKISPYVLGYVSDELKNDKEVVLESLKHNGFTIKDASDNLKNDKEVVLEAVKYDSRVWRYVGEDLKDDKDVVLEAIKHTRRMIDRYLFEYISDDLKNDEEVRDLLIEKGYIFDNNIDLNQIDEVIICDDDDLNLFDECAEFKCDDDYLNLFDECAEFKCDDDVNFLI